jgi:hypothetical protein
MDDQHINDHGCKFLEGGVLHDLIRDVEVDLNDQKGWQKAYCLPPKIEVAGRVSPKDSIKRFCMVEVAVQIVFNQKLNRDKCLN